jgi:hypothetical protein
VIPFAEAVIWDVPALTPVARPLLLTVATLVALLAHVNVTPLMVLPLLSFAVALNCWVPPTATEGDAGDTVMVATAGEVTVSVSAELVTPLAEAVIWDVPALTPVARPLLLTVATLGAPLAQVNVTPLMTLPLLSFAVALNCCVLPTATEGDDGATAMVATECVLELFEEPPQLVNMHSTARRNIDIADFRTATDKGLGFMLTPAYGLCVGVGLNNLLASLSEEAVEISCQG